MKNLGLFFFMAFSLSYAYSFDSEVSVDIDTAEIEVLKQHALTNELEEPVDHSVNEPAGYGQVFMFGFLILMALLVVWKFKDNG